MAISAELVKKLRDRTGAGMADCKKALEEADGNEEQAIEILRKKGAASAAKRADRVAKEGVIVVAVSDDKSKAVIAEVNSETDFVARNESFVEFAQDVADSALKASPNSQEEFLMTKLSSGITISEGVGEQTGRIGEKIEARRFEMVDSGSGVVASYIHPGSKLGVLVALKGIGADKGISLGRDIAMQVAAMNPLALSRKDVDSSTVNKEMDIFRTQLKNEGKKDEIIEKILGGKMDKFYQENTLLEQSFIKDASKTITDLLKEAGNGVEVTGFVRMQLGEGHHQHAEAEAQAA